MTTTDTLPMSDTWMSITDAAAVLECSTRTVNRRMARGELRRLERDGKVLVAIPEELRRPADRMVEAVQADAAQMRQLSAAVTQATEQAGIVLREALAQAKADATAALLRADHAEVRVQRSRRLSAALACAAVAGVSAAVSAWVVLQDTVQDARQMSATLSEARDTALSAQVRATVLEEQLERVRAERDGLGGDILELQYQLRTQGDGKPTP